MFKTLKNLLAGILAAVIVIAIGASVYTAFAAPGTNILAAQPQTVSANGNGNGGNGNSGNSGNTGNGTGTSVLDIPSSDLSADEAAALLFMREEEKLARDVYNALYTTWGIQTFTNVASSEQMHMDEIKILLDRYALADPALAPGQFTNPDLQALYNQLIAQGSLSIGDALKVGAAIEEIDILDLQTRFTQTDNADIQLVYNNLMNGSFNHLQAFSSVLTQQTGETYEPHYLPADQYQVIISSTNGNGSSNGQGNQGSNGQGNGAQGSNAQSNTAGTGIPQANISGATTVHGIVNSFDLSGMSVTLDDGTILYVQLGNSRYSQSIGFARSCFASHPYLLVMFSVI
ncbi:MAG: DUF2202 domain-containing protein [Anaerolineales bacterium]|nr:DUF2202 domain-containing protein [Anaerolineales bacterium]